MRPLGVRASDVRAGEVLAGADVVGQGLLEVVGVLGQQRPEPRLEVPGPQRAEGVVGLGEAWGTPTTTVAPAASKTAADPVTTDATSASTSRTPPRSAETATRRPVSVPETGGANTMPGSPSATGTRGSGPAITDSSSARSPTLRAIGPPTEVVSHRLSVGHDGTRPSEGRSPTTPQNDAGLRSEPPMSEPSASGTMPDARAHAAPPEEPPAERVGSTGLSVVPKTVLKVCEPAANSGTLVRPMTTTPAPRTRSTSRSSTSGTWSANSGEPYVVRHPATSWVSLNANGSPCRGPTSAPGRQRLVRGRGALAGPLLVERDDRVELGVALGDPGQVQVEQLAGGDLLASRRRRPGRGRWSRR